MKVFTYTCSAILENGLHVIIRNTELVSNVCNFNDISDLKTGLQERACNLLMIDLTDYGQRINWKEQVKQIYNDYPQLQVVLIETSRATSYNEIMAWLKLGAVSYVTTANAVAELERCLKSVLLGQRYLPEHFFKWIIGEKARINSSKMLEGIHITPSEYEVGDLLIKGYTLGEIATLTNRNKATVYSLKHNLIRKTKVSDIKELEAYIDAYRSLSVG